MTDMGTFFANYVANSLWQLPLFVVAAVLLERFLRRVGPLAQHRLWVSTLLAAVTMPALGASTRIIGWTRAAAGVSSYSIKMVDEPGSALVQGGAVHLPSVLFQIALALYFLMTLFAAVRLLTALRRTQVLRRAGKTVVFDVQAESLLRTFCHEEVAVLSCATITTPVTLGWRKPVLVVPSDFDKWDPEDAAAAIFHECAHIKRHDFLWNLLYEIWTLFVFYHPVTWFMKSRIAATRETVCDAVAAQQTATPASYARALLRIAGAVSIRPATAPAIGMFDGNVLEKRVMELMGSKQFRSKGPKLLVVAVAAAVFAAVCVGANAFSTNVDQKGNTGDGVSAQPDCPYLVSPRASKSEEALPKGCYRTAKGVTQPKLIKDVEPVFPPKAKEEKRTGRCTLGITVDDKGVPQGVNIIKSLAPDFDESAINAVKQWRFSPATLKGEPVPVYVSVEINFQLY